MQCLRGQKVAYLSHLLPEPGLGRSVGLEVERLVEEAVVREDLVLGLGALAVLLCVSSSGEKVDGDEADMLLLQIRLQRLGAVAGAGMLAAAVNRARVSDEDDIAPVKAAPVNTVHRLGDSGEGVLVE